MHVFKIWSRAIDRKGGGLLAYRTEFVGADKNELFSKYPKTEETVKAVHEAFWNLNKREPKIIVDKVRPINIQSKGKNWGIKILK